MTSPLPPATIRSAFTVTNAPSGAWRLEKLAPDVTGRVVRVRFTNPSGDADGGSLAEV